MGFQVGSLCYGTALDAVQAIAAGQVGTILVKGSVVYVVDVSAVTDASITTVLNPVGGGTALTTVVPVTPQPCGLLEWQDTLALGWLVVAAWVAVYAVKFLAKARLAND